MLSVLSKIIVVLLVLIAQPLYAQVETTGMATSTPMVLDTFQLSPLDYQALVETLSSADLLVHTKFDNDVLDASGNGFDGTVFGDLTYTSGHFNQAGVFNGVSSSGTCVELGSDPALAPTSAFTLSMWVKASANASGMALFSNSTNYGVHLQSNGSGAVDFWFSDSDTTMYSVTATGVEDGTWHLVTVTYDGTTLTMYKDGAFVTDASAGVPYYAEYLATLGCQAQSWHGYQWAGTMDDFRMYSRALSGTEVADLFNETVETGGGGETGTTTATTTLASVSGIEFGLAIIMVLIWLMAIGFMFNHLNEKKVWQ